MPMGLTAEKVGEQYKVTREEADLYAEKSQNRWRLGFYFNIKKKIKLYIKII